MTRPTFPTLKRAMTAYEIPLENHPVIERICAAIGVDSFVGYADHFRATRVGDGPDLRIHWGWTEGFVDLNEVLMATEGRWPYTQSDHLGVGMYYVHHPTNRLHPGGAEQRRSTPGLPVQTCSVHHMALPATGVCDDCD